MLLGLYRSFGTASVYVLVTFVVRVPGVSGFKFDGDLAEMDAACLNGRRHSGSLPGLSG